MFPVRNNLEVQDASLTPLGSPAAFQLDAFDSNAFGYARLLVGIDVIGLTIR